MAQYLVTEFIDSNRELRLCYSFVEVRFTIVAVFLEISLKSRDETLHIAIKNKSHENAEEGFMFITNRTKRLPVEELESLGLYANTSLGLMLILKPVPRSSEMVASKSAFSDSYLSRTA